MNKIRCAIYTRYSSDLQREASNEDQRRRGREFAAQKGWEVLEEYVIADSAISGQSLAPRTGLNKLLAIAKSGHCPFQYILVDDTSRVARNAREALQIFEELRYHKVYVFSVSQNIDGQSETAGMLVAMHGIVDAQLIQSISKSTHRGIVGQFHKGFSTGGKRFGYRSHPVYSGRKDRYGNPEADGYVLKIEPSEAKIVQEIFHLYGEECLSPRAIVTMLNTRLKETGAPRPIMADLWSQWAISGNPNKMRGILNSPIYMGTVYWNRTKTKKHPASGKAASEMRMPDEWIVRSAPELRIITDALWDIVKARQKLISDAINRKYCGAKRFYSRSLLTRLTKCSECGASFGMTSGGKHGRYGCMKNWNLGEGVCSNRVRVKRKVLEEAVCGYIEKKITNSDLPKMIHLEFMTSLSTCYNGINNTQEMALDRQQSLDGHKKRIQHLTDAIAINGFSAALKEALNTEERLLQELGQSVTMSGINSLQIVESLISEKDIRIFLLDITDKLQNLDTRRLALDSIVREITADCSVPGKVDMKISLNYEKISHFLNELIQKRDSRIRLQTGSRFIPYTGNEWRLILTTGAVDVPDVAGGTIYVVEKGIIDKRLSEPTPKIPRISKPR